MSEPPPPYSTTAVSHDPITQRDPVLQLSRYLLELMAFTFHADIADVNHALGQHTYSHPDAVSTTKSILTEAEKAEWLRLACLSKDMRGKEQGYQWLITPDCDRSALANAIVKPALQLELSPSYVLQLVTTYPDHQCNEAQRKHTLVSRNIPYPLCIFRHLSLFLGFLGHHIDSHARIIAAVSPNENIRMLLGDAMKVLQEEELGLIKVPHWADNRWPDEFGSWYDLWKALISEEEQINMMGQARRRRREKAKEGK